MFIISNVILLSFRPLHTTFYGIFNSFSVIWLLLVHYFWFSQKVELRGRVCLLEFLH